MDSFLFNINILLRLIKGESNIEKIIKEIVILDLLFVLNSNVWINYSIKLLFCI